MINLLLNRYCVVRDIFKLTRGGLLESNDNRVKQQSFVTPCEQKQQLFCWQTTNYSFRCLFILKLYLLKSISQLKLKLNRNIWNIFRSYLYKIQLSCCLFNQGLLLTGSRKIFKMSAKTLQKLVLQL